MDCPECNRLRLELARSYDAFGRSITELDDALSSGVPVRQFEQLNRAVNENRIICERSRTALEFHTRSNHTKASGA
jgi:hypothetical protein